VQEDPTLISPVSSGIHAEEVARRTFATVRKGADPREVHDFLQRVSRELERQLEREAELRRRLNDAEYRAAHPQLDEAALTTALGEETARVLRTAFDAAHEVKAKAEEGSARALAEATERAARVREEAEEAVAEKTRAADAEAERVTAAARADAEEVLEASRREGRAMLEEARQLRSRVLGDLSRRRRVLHDQVDRLRAGRERLIEATRVARTSLESIEQELRGAEEEVRPAAEGPGAETEGPGAETEGPGGEAGGPGGGTEVASTERPEAPEHRRAVHTETSPGPVQVQAEPPDVAGARAPGAVQAGPQSAVEADAPSGGPVGQLFARIKATQSGPREREQTPEAEQRDAPDGNGAGSTMAPPAGALHGSTDVAPEGSPAREPEGSPARESEGSPGTQAGGPAGEDERPPPSAAAETRGQPVQAVEEPVGLDQALFEQRDVLIGPLAQSLARRLKRTLQDEQNATLDQLRREAGRNREVQVFPPEREQQERFRQAAVEVLSEAERVGAEVAAGWNHAGGGAKRAGTGNGSVNVAARAGEAGPKEAEALAEEVVTALRRRLEERVGGQGGLDHSAAVEAVGATYREWRGSRIERAAMDHVVGAFSSGVVVATPEGTSLRWVSRDEDGECADCDDNALAGAVPPGEAFPTGQAHPPAHSGCRCLLAPATS
jgi:cell division septum initiation protein DivIVA